MRITALAGGVGGARFVRGLRHHLDTTPGLEDTEVTVVANTGDDITLFGLRVSPDVDTLLYTLGGGIDEAQGWGRADESHRVQSELAAYGAQPQWFALGDRDFGTHVVRSQWLGQGLSLSEVTARLAARWGLPEQRITLLPMTDTPVETHVVVDDGDGERAIHFQEWWVRHQASVPARRFVVAGLDRAAAAPGVLDAIRQADVVLLPPSNPVVSIGIVLGVPGVRDALRGTTAPVVGVSPLISAARCAGTPTRASRPSASPPPPRPSAASTRTSSTPGSSTPPTPARPWPAPGSRSSTGRSSCPTSTRRRASRPTPCGSPPRSRRERRGRRGPSARRAARGPGG